MGTFDLNCNSCESSCNESHSNCGRSNGEHCIIAYKVFDQYRSQVCLTPDILGPARASGFSTQCGETLQPGDVIVPPIGATNVTISNLETCEISILCKNPNSFKPGYWDVEIKYVFCYNLTFKDCNCNEICSVPATNCYKTKATLYGGLANDISMATDLFGLENTFSGTGPY